jgi:chromosomal replication initiation ATPase DnaA
VFVLNPGTCSKAADAQSAFGHLASEYPGDVELIEQTVLRVFDLPIGSLMSPRRGRANVAFARQVAIYIAHVHLGMTLTRAAQLFGRDRTTAAHACRTVEDRRDERLIDLKIESIEHALENWDTAAFARILGSAHRPEDLQ